MKTEVSLMPIVLGLLVPMAATVGIVGLTAVVSPSRLVLRWTVIAYVAVNVVAVGLYWWFRFPAERPWVVVWVILYNVIMWFGFGAGRFFSWLRMEVTETRAPASEGKGN